MKILLVQTSFFGDVVLSTPLITEIKQRHPAAELWVMTTPAAAPLLEDDPLVEGVIPFDKRGSNRGVGGIFRMARYLKQFGFDKVYCLHRSLRTALVLALSAIPSRVGFKESRGHFLFHKIVNRRKGVHDVLRNLSLLEVREGTAGDQASLDRFPLRLTCSRPLPRERIFPVGGDRGDSGYMVLVPGSVWRTKRWSEEQYHLLCQTAVEQGLRVCILGTAAERETCEKVARQLQVANLAGETDLQTFVAIIRDASLVVCNDSFALHVAAAFQVPTVAVFCATSPTFGFYPWQKNARVVEKVGLWCKPCRRHGSMQCPTGTEICMRDVSWREVWFHCAELLKSLPRD